MKVGLAACEIVQHPVRIIKTCVNIKKRISFIMNAAADFHSPVVKNEVSTLFQGILLYEDQHP